MAMGAFGGRRSAGSSEYRHALESDIELPRVAAGAVLYWRPACRLISARWWRIRCAFCCCWPVSGNQNRHAVAGREAVGVPAKQRR